MRLAAPRIQLSTDGLKLYLEAVEDAFGANVDYGMIIKLYGEDPQPQKRYSPAQVLSIEKREIQGNPDWAKISTSYVERQNLSMRMSMRRFTRLTNSFSKKWDNHCYAIAINFMVYNFVKPHGTLTKHNDGHPMTPAMAAKVTTKQWRLEDVVGLLS